MSGSYGRSFDNYKQDKYHSAHLKTISIQEAVSSSETGGKRPTDYLRYGLPEMLQVRLKT